MLSANFKPKRIAAASRGFLAIARLSCQRCQRTSNERKMPIAHRSNARYRYLKVKNTLAKLYLLQSAQNMWQTKVNYYNVCLA